MTDQAPPASAAGASAHVSIVVPTYNEAGNVRPLLAALEQALGGLAYEVVFADDSSDETPRFIENAAAADPRVKLHHRSGRKGLASAVVDALPLTSSDRVVVMDGDLQHPPDLIPKLLKAQEEKGADVVVASRYTLGGGAGGLSGPLRVFASFSTRLAAYAILPRARLTTDPLSGFFLFRRAAVEGARLRPVGYKILLEVLIRGRVGTVADVPFVFQKRAYEKSKAGPREAWNYLRQLWRLRA